MAKGTAITTVFPYAGLLTFLLRTAHILTRSKHSDKAFRTETRLLSKSAVFALWTYASLVVGGLQGGHGRPNFLMGAVRVLCRHAP